MGSTKTKKTTGANYTYKWVTHDVVWTKRVETQCLGPARAARLSFEVRAAQSISRSGTLTPLRAFNLPPRMTSTFSSVLEIFLRLPLDMPMPCSMTYDQCLMMSFCEIPRKYIKVSISSTSWLTFSHTLTLKHLGWNPLSLSSWFTTCHREGRLGSDSVKTNAAEVLCDLDLHQSIFNQQHCTHLARLHKGIP